MKPTIVAAVAAVVAVVVSWFSRPRRRPVVSEDRLAAVDWFADAARGEVRT